MASNYTTLEFRSVFMRNVTHSTQDLWIAFMLLVNEVQDKFTFVIAHLVANAAWP